MGADDFDGAVDSFCEARLNNNLGRTLSKCVPRSLKEGLIFVILSAMIVWTLVTFYHGWNMGCFQYNDADVAVNIDCHGKGYESNHIREACKGAQLAKGVHPLIFATEHTLRTGRDCLTNGALAIVGSSVIMIALLSVVAFLLALWYVKPSTRDAVMIPGVFSGCGVQQSPHFHRLSPPDQRFPGDPAHALIPMTHSKGLDQILGSNDDNNFFRPHEHNKFE